MFIPWGLNYKRTKSKQWLFNRAVLHDLQTEKSCGKAHYIFCSKISNHYNEISLEQIPVALLMEVTKNPTESWCSGCWERGRAAVPPLLHALCAAKKWMCKGKVLVITPVVNAIIWVRGHNRKGQAFQNDFKSAVTPLLSCFCRDSYETSSWKAFTGKYMLAPIKAQPSRP